MRNLFSVLMVLLSASFALAQSDSPMTPRIAIQTNEAAFQTDLLAPKPDSPQDALQTLFATNEPSVSPTDVPVAVNPAVSAQVAFLMNAGMQYADEGEYADAERAYSRALQGDPKNPDIRFRLSTLYIQTGHYKDAAKLLEDLVAEYPDSPMVRNNLAWIYATGGEVRNGKLALFHAREALLTAPYSPAMWNTLAEAYYVSGQYEQALRASGQAIDLLVSQESSEQDRNSFAAQNAKIRRAVDSYNTLLKLDKNP